MNRIRSVHHKLINRRVKMAVKEYAGKMIELESHVNLTKSPCNHEIKFRKKFH